MFPFSLSNPVSKEDSDKYLSLLSRTLAPEGELSAIEMQEKSLFESRSDFVPFALFQINTNPLAVAVELCQVLADVVKSVGFDKLGENIKSLLCESILPLITAVLDKERKHSKVSESKEPCDQLSSELFNLLEHLIQAHQQKGEEWLQLKQQLQLLLCSKEHSNHCFTEFVLVVIRDLEYEPFLTLLSENFEDIINADEDPFFIFHRVLSFKDDFETSALIPRIFAIFCDNALKLLIAPFPDNADLDLTCYNKCISVNFLLIVLLSKTALSDWYIQSALSTAAIDLLQGEF